MSATIGEGKLRYNVGTCLRHVSMQSAMLQRIIQHAEGESTEKVDKTDFRAVSNGYKPPKNLYFIHYCYSFSVLSPKACPYAMALSFDISSYPGMILYLCLGVLGGIVVVFWVVWGFLGWFW